MASERRWKPRRRTLWLLGSLLLFMPPLSLVFQVTTGDHDFCGRWCPRMFFVWHSGANLGQFLMGFARAFAGVALLVGILAATAFFGRFWCSHACPVGAASELGSRLVPRWAKLSFRAVPAAPVRYGYLAVYLLAPALGIGSLCCSYCNLATVPRLFGAAFSSADLAYFLRTAGLVNLGLVLVLGPFAAGGRAYCNFFCPVGALDALVARATSRFGKRYRVREERCTSCGHCVEACPTWAIASGSAAKIDPLSCIPCGECQEVCPEGAIEYAKLESPSDGTGTTTQAAEVSRVA